MLLPWPAGLWYPPISLEPVKSLPPGKPQTRAAAPEGPMAPGQTGVGPKRPPPRLVRGPSKGLWGKCWLRRWGRWGGCRRLVPLCWPWGGCCRCKWLCWRSCWWLFRFCRCCWGSWSCSTLGTARFGLSFWSVTVVILPVTLVPMAVPKVLLPCGAASSLTGWSGPSCVSLQEGNERRFNSDIQANCRAWCTTVYGKTKSLCSPSPSCDYQSFFDWGKLKDNFISQESQFTAMIEKYHLGFCDTAQRATSARSTHVTNTNMAANLAQKHRKKMTISTTLDVLTAAVVLTLRANKYIRDQLNNFLLTGFDQY